MRISGLLSSEMRHQSGIRNSISQRARAFSQGFSGKASRGDRDGGGEVVVGHGLLCHVFFYIKISLTVSVCLSSAVTVPSSLGFSPSLYVVHPHIPPSWPLSRSLMDSMVATRESRRSHTHTLASQVTLIRGCTVRTPEHTHTHTCIHTHIHTHIKTHTRARAHTHTQRHTHGDSMPVTQCSAHPPTTHTHTHKHTHTQCHTQNASRMTRTTYII